MSHILIGGLTLRWIVSILFAASMATYLYIVVAQHDRWTSIVNHLLHFTMWIAMILMAWHIGMNLPTVGPMIFFLLAGVWFVRVACRASCAARVRVTSCYNALMMAAMAWMYAIMNASLPGQRGHTADRTLSGSLAMNTSGMEMPAHGMFGNAPGPEWISIVNWIVSLGFAIAALYWSCRFFATRRISTVTPAAQLARMEPLYQALSAAGTALIFGSLLVVT